MRYASLLAILVSGSCIPSIRIDDAAQISCNSNADCPATLTCLVDAKRCVDPDNLFLVNLELRPA